MNIIVPYDNRFDVISFIYKNLITKNCTEKRISVQILMKRYKANYRQMLISCFSYSTLTRSAFINILFNPTTPLTPLIPILNT